MDRIRKALDMARQQRDLGAGPHDARGGRRAARERCRRCCRDIIYTETQVFQPEPGSSRRIASSIPRAAMPAAAAFRMLRTQVMQRMDEHGWRSIAVLSPGADDGKTTTAVNLAVSLATTGITPCCSSTAISSARPSAGCSASSLEYGVDDVLRGDAHIGRSASITRRASERLVVLPARGAARAFLGGLGGPAGALAGRGPEADVIRNASSCSICRRCWARTTPWHSCRRSSAPWWWSPSMRRGGMTCCAAWSCLHKTPIVGTVLNKATGSRLRVRLAPCTNDIFRLRSKPFAMSPDPAFLFPSAQHAAALTMLEYALESQAPFCVLTGEIGSGKTTLAAPLPAHARTATWRSG